MPTAGSSPDWAICWVNSGKESPVIVTPGKMPPGPVPEATVSAASSPPPPPPATRAITTAATSTTATSVPTMTAVRLREVTLSPRWGRRRVATSRTMTVTKPQSAMNGRVTKPNSRNHTNEHAGPVSSHAPPSRLGFHSST